MRKNGTKYPVITEYNPKMIPVSEYATNNDIEVGQVYMQYERHFVGYKNKKGELTGTKGPYPGYIIRQFNKMNYVIPD